MKLGRAKGKGVEHAQVQVLPHSIAQAAGVDGVLLAVRGYGKGKGKAVVDVALDYSDFRDVYGGDWASRLTLRKLPHCALTTPGKKSCSVGKPLPTRNDPVRDTLATSVKLTGADTAEAEVGSPVASSPMMRGSATRMAAASGTVLLAADAAESGPSGDFGATKLSPSGKWQAGGSSGSFSWSYALDTPSVPGGLGPDLSLSYSSQAVDGRTAATNNQANWVGDGWSLSPGFIERRYVPCEDDKDGGNNPSTKVGDQCWKEQNATLSLGGSSSELVHDDATGEWRKKDDDGTRIAHLTSDKRGNGDNDGEYWRVTTPDGVRYYFGYNRLPGWSSGDPETDSVWTVPVFGNQSGEPCHASAFGDSWCRQAWRWNLDYVVDPRADAMAYYWAKETNHYALNVDETTAKGTPTSYTRGGYLKSIEYGLRSDSVFSDKAAAKVDFTVDERCLATDSFDCATDKFTEDNADKWPDVPFDQYCKSGDDCQGNASPSYWTRKRLTGITSYALVDGSYEKVDSWKLEQSFPATGDGSDPPLWLKSITRTGHTGDEAVTLPSVTFHGLQLPNRVEGAVDPVPAYNRYRVYAIDTETGGTIGVTYSDPQCTASTLPDPATNTERCYPVIWSPPDAPAPDYEPYEDWFHTYVVTQILQTDNTGGAPAEQTEYTYLGGMAWAKSKDEFTKPDRRTYGDRRGYGHVRVVTGTTDDEQTRTETRYFRGIDGDDVTDSEGTAVTDREAFAGMTREKVTYDAVDGKVINATSHTPWRSAPTASHARDGLTDLEARHTGVKTDATRELVSDGSWRRTTTTRDFDSYGMVTAVSETGDTRADGDERCTTTTYARNTDDNILSLVAEKKTVATTCDTEPALPDDLISTTRTYYDGATDLNATPTKGDATRSDENDGPGTGYITVKTATYDQYGRVLTQTDAGDNTTTTDYTPATGQAPTKTVATNPLGHTHTTITDPRRGTTTAVIDANGKRTDVTYDALGRTTQVWEPAWSKTDHPATPSAQYSYSVSKTKPVVVTSKTLRNDGTYGTAYTFFDGLLRQRETQSPAHGDPDGKIVTETLYNTLGQTWKTYASYYATGTPGTTLATAADNEVPTATVTRYDGAGRPAAAISLKYGDETRRSTTVHDGADRTTVIPPDGGTAETTVTNALGQTTQRLTYTNDARTEHNTTSYGYDVHGKLANLTDPAGNEWTWTFDTRGRQITADDPDKGVTTTGYDDLDRPVETTDARDVTLTTVYDALGRPTQLKQGETIRAKWSYDQVAKGQPDTTTRYVDGHAYTTEISSYDDRYQPTKTTVTLPGSEGALGRGYTFTSYYDPETGQLNRLDEPAIGNLPAERIAHSYTSDGLPKATTSSTGLALATDTHYDVFSRPERTQFGAGGWKMYDTRTWDEHTGELTSRTIDGEVAKRIEGTHYTYDDAGNVTRVQSTSGQDSQAVTDNQCFSLDALQRITDAWTTVSPDDDCSSAPTAETVGGPDAYWHSYSYDAVGNRKQDTQHPVGAEEQVTRTYTYGDAGQDAPHTLQSVTTQGGAEDGRTESFTYDKAGNTTNRTGGDTDQTLTWSPEGHLRTVTENAATTTYLYGADGDRLLSHNADGSTTAYLPGGNEIKAVSNTVTGSRYYTHGSNTIAVRTPNGVKFLFPDQQGTALIAVAAGLGQAVTRRRQLPFGAPRNGGTTAWPTPHGFLGGTNDSTGTTHLGAREYDPQLGRFLSVDPKLIVNDPSQHNPYTYAANNPATFTDPTGTQLADCALGRTSCTAGRPDRPMPGSDNCYTGNMSASCIGTQPPHGYHGGGRPWTPPSQACWPGSASANCSNDPPYQPGSDNCYGGNMSASCLWAQPGGGNPRVAQQQAASLAKSLARAAAQQHRQQAENKTSILGGIANFFSGVSAVTGWAATVTAFIPGMQGVAAGLAVVSLAAGAAATVVSAADAIWGTGSWSAVGVNALGTAFAVAGGGAGKLIGRQVARLAPRAEKAATSGLSAYFPARGSARAFTGITGRTYSAAGQNAVFAGAHAGAGMPGGVWGTLNTDWSNWP